MARAERESRGPEWNAERRARSPAATGLRAAAEQAVGAGTNLVAQAARLSASAERVIGMWDAAAERAMDAMDAAAEAAAEAATSFDGGAWAAENEGAWTDATATAASGVPPNLAIEDTEAWINSGMARWNRDASGIGSTGAAAADV